jgi:hypothetical protein
MTLSNGEFRENSCSENHNLLKSGVKFFPFYVHFSSEIKSGVGDVDRSLLGYGRLREKYAQQKPYCTEGRC